MKAHTHKRERFHVNAGILYHVHTCIYSHTRKSTSKLGSSLSPFFVCCFYHIFCILTHLPHANRFLCAFSFSILFSFSERITSLLFIIIWISNTNNFNSSFGYMPLFPRCTSHRLQFWDLDKISWNTNLMLSKIGKFLSKKKKKSWWQKYYFGFKIGKHGNIETPQLLNFWNIRCTFLLL